MSTTEQIETATAQQPQKKGFKQTEVGLIPEDWEVLQVGNCLSQNPDYGINAASVSYNEDLPTYLRITDISEEGRFISNTKVSVKDTDSDNFYLIEGDLVFARTGASVGKTYLYNKRDGELVFAGFLIRVKPDVTKLIPHYLKYWTQTKFYNDWIGTNSTRTGQPGINGNEFKEIPIPLPQTLSEQTAIATALSDMDALIEAQEQLIAKKRAIKQGAMQELLQPKEGWENDELGRRADVLRGGSPRPIESFLTTDQNGFNWVKIGDVKKGAKYISSTEEKIKSSGIFYSRIVNEGDFLLSNSMSFGRPYIMKIKGCIHDGWLVIQNYQETFDTDFLYYILGFESTLNQYKKLAAGSTVLNLNKEIVSHVNVPIPDKHEQTRIANILSEMDTEIEQLETELAKLKQLKAGMMQELLTGKKRLV